MSKAQQKGLQAPNLFQSCRIWNNVYLWFSLLLFLIHIVAEHKLQATIHLQWQELWNYFCQYLSFLNVSCIFFILLPFFLDLSRSRSCCCLFGLLFCLQVRGAAASCFASFARRNPPQELTKVIQINL